MNLKDQVLIIFGIKRSSSQGSRNHHLRDQGTIILRSKGSSLIKGLSSQGSRDYHLRDQRMNFKDLEINEYRNHNLKDQMILIHSIKGFSSQE